MSGGKRLGISRDRLELIIENELTLGMSPSERKDARKLAAAIALAMAKNNREISKQLGVGGEESKHQWMEEPRYAN